MKKPGGISWAGSLPKFHPSPSNPKHGGQGILEDHHHTQHRRRHRPGPRKPPHKGRGKTTPPPKSRRLAGGHHRDDQHPRAGAPPRVRPGLRLHGRLRPPPAPLHLPLPRRRRCRRWAVLLPPGPGHNEIVKNISTFAIGSGNHDVLIQYEKLNETSEVTSRRSSTDLAHVWNKAVDETLGRVVVYLSSRGW